MSILALNAHVSSAAAGSTTVDAVSYACANNETMRVVYVNGADGKSFAILLQMDEMIPMAEQRTASGAVYRRSIEITPMFCAPRQQCHSERQPGNAAFRLH
ncbi:membrane-bound lysozyme-inhibitor of c-type lysozyme domain-containing protein [Ditylenchus destructor]|nr:membrane-bound lysozyme-inhibitor of c-type lysozyme domain-containing protein [Ditylenchus destructor]